MAQNIYDRQEFFEGYSQLPRSTGGLALAPEWPTLQAMLPPLAGSRVADLGCGFGWFCRWASEQGAVSVLGVDVSEKMLERARREPGVGIEYLRADLETLELAANSFELVYSSLALHYIADFARIAEMVHGALVPGGWFVFSIEHPVFMAPSQPGWLTNAEGHKTWPVDGYSLEGPRVTNWLADGVVKHHRTIGTTLNQLIGAGFSIAHVEEFRPTDAQIAVRPGLAEEVERPMFLLVSAHRSHGGQ